MRLNYYLLFLCFYILILFFQCIKAENEKQNTHQIILKNMEAQIKELNEKFIKTDVVIKNCKRIFHELERTDGINISVNFYDDDVDPFGYSIVKSLEINIGLLNKNEQAEKSKCSSKTELEICKTELNTLKNVTATNEQFLNTEKNILEKINDINKLLTNANNHQQPTTIFKAIKTRSRKPKGSKDKPESCNDIIENGLSAGKHKIFTTAGEIEVFCDKFGRMLIQHQMVGSIDFNRNWKDYKLGFGTTTDQYWFGLEKLYLLTSTDRYELFYIIKDFDDNVNYANYDHFRIGNEAEAYKILQVGAYSGNTTDDGFKNHLNYKFSTKDRDNTAGNGTNCAITYKSGWWYHSCGHTNLNKLIGNRDYKPIVGKMWKILSWNNEKPLKEASMYIKLYD